MRYHFTELDRQQLADEAKTMFKRDATFTDLPVTPTTQIQYRRASTEVSDAPARRKRLVKRIAMVAALVTLGALAALTTASAHAGPPAGLADFAPVYRAIASDDNFQARYNDYRRLFPGFNWSNDGCSGPAHLSGYSDNFRWPCIQHDFGYRNNHLDHQHDENTRKFIDEQFLRHMREVCQRYDNAIVKRPAKLACFSAAEAFYAAVRNGARSSWH